MKEFTMYMHLLILSIALLCACTALSQPFEVCDIPIQPVENRINNRDYPSVFQAWGGVGWTRILNLPEVLDIEHISHHDLYFTVEQFEYTDGGEVFVNNNATIIERHNLIKKQNPNMLFLIEIRMRDAFVRLLGENFPYWIRDENGEIVYFYDDLALLDFTHLEMQERIINEAVAIAECGLYDGIMIDWWHETFVSLADGSPVAPWGSSDESGYRGMTAEQTARDNILNGIRSRVRDDFLILGNTNRNKLSRTAWGVNGAFMEVLARDGYTHKDIKQIEDALIWNEKNLRAPQINCLEGHGNPTQPPDSPDNKQWMRLFTTMSLTHSDGYVMFNDGKGGHKHFWYPFWNANLGRPITDKSIQYDDGIDGLYIREYTNGFAVYNRSGIPQQVVLPTTIGYHSRIRSEAHFVNDLDGEIYIKKIADINTDGRVNILDLVQIANAFGHHRPDVNSDGIVNILDLVFVANAFETTNRTTLE